MNWTSTPGRVAKPGSSVAWTQVRIENPDSFACRGPASARLCREGLRRSVRYADRVRGYARANLCLGRPVARVCGARGDRSPERVRRVTRDWVALFTSAQ